MNAITLSPLEVKVLNKFSLTKADIFLDQVSRNESKEVTDNETGEVKTIPATTYINIRGFIWEKGSAKIAIFPETNELSCRVSTPTWEFDSQTNKATYDTEYVPAKQFKELLSERRTSSKEDIDSV